MNSRLMFLFNLAFVLLINLQVKAAPGDTTYVQTFQQDFYNWATPHYQTFLFPDTSKHYSKVTLFYKLECPSAPGDCDPWDRLGYLSVVKDSVEYEIARIVTPYDINNPGYPGSCTWELDVTDYQTLLTDSVTFKSYIETWINGNKGWLVTVDFEFIEASPPILRFPYKVQRLWQNYHAVYGEPADPIDSHLQPMTLDVEQGVDSMKIRVIATGHGQGNTDNAAEFSNKTHIIVANGTPQIHTLWRSDCNVNPCSPQLGTWTYSRAGWCPGDKVIPWDVDVTPYVTAGSQAVIDYNIDWFLPYENLCRPTNPNCIPNGVCTDCNYNSTGHTEPIYAINSQAIFYKTILITEAGEQTNKTAKTFRLENNFPNPFNPTTTIGYELSGGQKAKLLILNVLGETVFEFLLSKKSGSVVWNGTDFSGKTVSSGIYFYRLETENGFSETKKMVLLK